MLNNYFVKCLIVTAAIILLIATIQVGTAIYFSKSAILLKPADLVVVFPGDHRRMDTGMRLLQEGLSNNFMVVSRTPENLKQLLTKDIGPNTVTVRPGGKSRSTFEDVFQTAKMVNANNMHSIIVVTSSYHLPRAIFLLKMFLIFSGSDATIQGFPGTKEYNLKLFSNEIVKFWGSLVEMGGCVCTDTLSLDNPIAKKVQTILKKRLLWK